MALAMFSQMRVRPINYIHNCSNRSMWVIALALYSDPYRIIIIIIGQLRAKTGDHHNWIMWIYLTFTWCNKSTNNKKVTAIDGAYGVGSMPHLITTLLLIIVSIFIEQKTLLCLPHTPTHPFIHRISMTMTFPWPSILYFRCDYCVLIKHYIHSHIQQTELGLSWPPPPPTKHDNNKIREAVAVDYRRLNTHSKCFCCCRLTKWLTDWLSCRGRGRRGVRRQHLIIIRGMRYPQVKTKCTTGLKCIVSTF